MASTKKTIKKKKTSKKPANKKKLASIASIVENVQGLFNSELIKTLSSVRERVATMTGISWGSVSLNYICTGNPFVGIIPGRIYEVFGKEGSGKTTILLQAIAEAQKDEQPTAFIDAEHALNLIYAQALGVNLEELIFSQPDYGEQGIEIVIALIKAGVKLIVIDSVVGLTPLAIIEGNMEKSHMAQLARMMSQGLMKMSVLLSKHDASVVFINQIRERPGVMFGNPEYTPGGNALKFYASFRLVMQKSDAKSKALKGANATILGKKEKERIGAIWEVKCVKNKLWKPFQDAQMPFYYGHGIDQIGDLYGFAENFGLITKSKGHFVVGKEKVNYIDMADKADLVYALLREKWDYGK